MKKVLVLFVIAFLALSSFAGIATSAEVAISPSQPSDSDNLVCSVAGSSDDYDFYWYKNGQLFKQDFGSSSIISAADTSAGETWTCRVYTPSDSFVGEAAVGIGQAAAGTVVIEPTNPTTNDNLVGYVAGSSDDYDFYWYKNGQPFKQDFGTSSVIAASDTTQGQTWTLKVYTPSGSFVGEASVGIETAAAGTVVIEPDKAYTTDNLKGYVAGSSDDYDFQWYKNGETSPFKTDFGSSSIINATDTKKNENWTLKVYTPSDSFVGEASKTILNTVPVVSGIPNIIMNQDTSYNLNLAGYVSDADIAEGDTITWTAQSSTINITVNIQGGIATITPATGWSGTGSITFIATDSDGASSSYVVNVTVNPVPSQIPDLAVTLAANDMQLGESQGINATINNIGTVAAGSFSVDMLVDGRLQSRITVAGLAAGSSTSLTFVFVPQIVGTYNITIIADSLNNVTERNESNNAASKLVNVVYQMPAKIKIFGLELSPILIVEDDYAYMTITNTAHSIKQLKLTISVKGTNIIKTETLGLKRNEARIIPLYFGELSKGQFVAKLAVDSDEFSGYNYIFIENH